MTMCAMKFCRNYKGKINTKKKITFHLLPTDRILKNRWINIIRKARKDNDWKPSKSSCVCSEHFHECDMNIRNEDGRRRVKKGAVPSKKLDSLLVMSSNSNTSDIEITPSESDSTKKMLNSKNREEMPYDKVFVSNITRTHYESKNNLNDILRIDPVKPLPVNNTKTINCDFVPKTDKQFIPKKKIRLKVKTVRDIRNLFEKDIYSTLENDLEKQQNNLLRKIRGGSSKDEKTKLLARNILNSEKPISRVAWQMVINVNPDDHIHSSQYVLWNGKKIQVNGSRGGKSKFICKYDLGKQRATLAQRNEFKSNSTTKRYLLKHSSNVKFKPGPLSRKKELDVSYQKYNIGSVELAHLPKPGLDIRPEYGKPLEPSITNFLHQLRDVNGIISDKWAEFAVSTLGTEENGRAMQLNKDCCVTFDLNYKYDQRRLLMRHDTDSLDHKRLEQITINNSYIENEKTTIEEIKNMLDNMINSVEISLLQNNMYTGEDSPREVNADDIITSSVSHVKRKGELNRLDVTVIRLPDSEDRKKVGVCLKSFCALGCVCDSIFSSFQFKKHCGHIECMFECKCDFSKYGLQDCFEDEIIPGLVNFDKEHNLKLSKEEQKFHQTVVFSGEKSILLKSQRRNWKAPKRYAEFYSNMRLKTKKRDERILSVVDIKLNCATIEPWCMIHNLYKCFCKGKFTERLTNFVLNDVTKTKDNSNNTIQPEIDLNDRNIESTTKVALRPRIRQDVTIGTKSETLPSANIKHVFNEKQSYQEQCTRTKVYSGRKYSQSHYLNANKKIKEMEKDDQRLRKRMMDILKPDEIIDIKRPKTDSHIIDLSTSPVPSQSDEQHFETEEITQNEFLINSPTCDRLSTDLTSPILNTKLRLWLEPILKMFRHRFNQGFSKKSLDPPKGGKVALYPWHFILDRYQNRKNIFLVSKHKPSRIYMAINSEHVMFENCINVRDIVNLEKCPESVRNIIINNTEGLKDQLCILRGLEYCWELIGSIKKMFEIKDHESEQSFIESASVIECSTQNSSLSKNLPAISTFDEPSSSGTDFSTQNSLHCISSPATSRTISVENSTEQSRWFVMTVENDFNEIQFYNRGFFVKFECIIKAVNIARTTEKTVRLSAQKSIEANTDPQFGIYAIPNENEHCVIIGPYEKNETLGIETIKTGLYSGKKRTRGVWITTNKVDNLNVIANPLYFMSQVKIEHEEVLDDFLQGDTNINTALSIENSKNKIVKLAKPIKIPKTNSFYHLTSSGIFKQIPVPPEKQNFIPKTQYINKNLQRNADITVPSAHFLRKSSLLQSNKNNKSPKRPIAEIAPQVKVTVKCSENTTQSVQQKPLSTKKSDGCMFILKPEEINKRSLDNNVNSKSLGNCNAASVLHDSEIEIDIENDLAHSVESIAPNTDVYVISDDEDYCNNEINSNTNIEQGIEKNWNDVLVICKNVKNIGWIAGRQDANKHLSFEFPGFKYTEFYPIEEAFAKINQVLSRKIYIPKHIDLSWCVVETKEDLKNKQKLRQEDFGPDFVLTKHGLMHKSQITGRKKADSVDLSSASCIISPNKIKLEEATIHNTCNVGELETENNSSDEEAEQLLRQSVLKRNELSNSFSKMTKDKRQEISDRLRSIISSANSS